MNAYNFDRFTRAFARPASRRGLLAVAGGFLALRRHQTDAAQLTPDSCASTGEVCTLLYGCCSGLSCATSAINPSYGVCIPGDGGTVSTGTALVVPFDEGDSTAPQPAVDDTSTSTTTTDPQAEREQRIAEHKARRDAHRNKIDLRKDQQQDKKEDQQDKRELARGPELEFRLTLEGDVDSLKVFNRDNQTVVLNKIGSILTTSEEADLTPVQLNVGESYLFISGKLSPQDTNRFEWASRRLCDTTGDGFVVAAAFSSNSDNFDYEILCDGPSIVLFDHPDKKNKGGNNGNNNNGKNRKQQRNKGRGNKKHKNG